MKKNKAGPKILFIDVETRPLLAYVWGLFDQNVGLNQIKEDWAILSFSAKWAGDKGIIYHDRRCKKGLSSEKALMKKIRSLLDEADIVIGQNVARFDVRKINAKFLEHDINKPSSYRIVDTLKIMRKHFDLTSNKLEYASKLLNKKFKKQDHKKFPGFSLWAECLKGNKEAWKEMETYNKYDVLALEELYYILAPWDNTINFDVYYDEEKHVCSCGSEDFKLNGFAYTSTGMYQRYVCKDCGREHRGRTNLFSKEKKKSLRR